MTAKRIVLPGDRFGRLTILKEVEKDQSKYGFRRFLVRCDCGNEKILRAYNLFSGDSKSCGCYKLEKAAEVKTTHGMCGTRMYNSWRGMRERCSNPKNKKFKDYGGRGIKYDPFWDDFENFYKDMIDGYSEELTLDRIDVNGNYCKENCRWVTWSIQQQNKREAI